jgi:cellulose biosynthesis protein BcsQ
MIIMVGGEKGGAGKTTLAMHLAVAARRWAAASFL